MLLMNKVFCNKESAKLLCNFANKYAWLQIVTPEEHDAEPDQLIACVLETKSISRHFNLFVMGPLQ